MAIEILLGSNVTTEPLRRIILYWSRDKLLADETEDSESWRGGMAKDGETLSEASSIQLPFKLLVVFGTGPNHLFKLKTTISSGLPSNFG
jgi:hypothetical protein